MKPFIDQAAMNRLHQRITHTTLPDNPIIPDISNRLLERLDYICIQPEVILNYGWHTDHSDALLKNRYRNAIIQHANDLQSMHAIENNSVHFIVAHFALLRERDPMYLLQEFSRILCDEGLLLFTSLGPDTFIELRQSFLQVDSHPHVHPFSDMHDMGDWMKQLHFSDPVVDREEIILAYDSLEMFFDDLKKLCATNVHQLRQKGLLSKNKWQNMLLHYAQYKKENYFPVTLEVIYGHGWKIKQFDDDNVFQNEIAISIDSIKIK